MIYKKQKDSFNPPN